MLHNRARNQKGFTLVELLIVVIILGILAAVVIPQFNTAASESKEAALASNLATIRQAIEMYKVQHNDVFPTAAIETELTTKTNISGGTTGTLLYGPYLRNSFPKNPVDSANSTLIGTSTTAGALPAGDGGSQWFYNTADGAFFANTSGSGPSGTAYTSL